MKNYEKSFLLTVVILIGVTIVAGCNLSNPITPEIEPNPTENPENSIVSYIKVTASSPQVKVYQPVQLVVRGYNADDQWVILDKSKLKLWKWTVTGQCPTCIAGEVDLKPKSSSLTTSFTSGVSGTFYVGAYYQGNVAGDYLTDYVEIKVVK